MYEEKAQQKEEEVVVADNAPLLKEDLPWSGMWGCGGVGSSLALASLPPLNLLLSVLSHPPPLLRMLKDATSPSPCQGTPSAVKVQPYTSTHHVGPLSSET